MHQRRRPRKRRDNVVTRRGGRGGTELSPTGPRDDHQAYEWYHRMSVCGAVYDGAVYGGAVYGAVYGGAAMRRERPKVNSMVQPGR